jgi:glycosyltransferase involved in cell wall biosynthesis
VIPVNGEARHVMHYLGNVGMTGVETFLLTLCAAQRRRGITPSVVCDVEGREEFLASATAMGVDVHPVPLGATTSLAAGTARKILSVTHRGRRVQRISQLLSSTRAEVMHVHAVGIGGLDAFVAARRGGVPFVVTHHATLSWFEPFRNWTSDLTFWFERKSAARIVCPYGAARDQMVAHGAPVDRTSVVPFCVDARKFDRGVERAPSRGSPFRILFVARLIEGKGHGDLLRAVASLRHLHDRLQVVIVGDGPLRSQIEEEVRALGLDGLVAITGHVANERVPELMREASVVALPSYMPGETFPLSLIEAMAMRIPVIASRWFGIPDIVAHGETGLLVEPRDVSSLARAIERLANDPELAQKFGQNGHERAMKLFTSDAVAASYGTIYEEATQAQPLSRASRVARPFGIPA